METTGLEEQGTGEMNTGQSNRPKPMCKAA